MGSEDTAGVRTHRISGFEGGDKLGGGEAKWQSKVRVVRKEGACKGHLQRCSPSIGSRSLLFRLLLHCFESLEGRNRRCALFTRAGDKSCMPGKPYNAA